LNAVNVFRHTDMIFSATAEYALRAVILIAERGGAQAISGSEVARELDAPHNYMSKIMHRLARAELLVSTRGKGGGFRLARPAEDIMLVEVVCIFDAVNEGQRCVLGRPECSDSNPCALHTRWKPMAEAFTKLIRETSVADVQLTGTGKGSGPHSAFQEVINAGGE